MERQDPPPNPFKVITSELEWDKLLAQLYPKPSMLEKDDVLETKDNLLSLSDK